VNCKEAKKAIGAWSAGGDIPDRKARDLESHVQTCPSCGPAYADVLPFILRDAQRVSTVEAAVAVPSPGAGPAPARRALKKGRSLIPILVFFVALPFFVAGIIVVNWWLGSGRGVDVLFSLDAPEARSVSLVGDFTSWEGSGLTMKDENGDGVWTITVRLKKGSTYRYNFRLDEERLIADPASTLRVPDGFGGESSVLQVK
jgi:hypothetical protein